MYSPYDVRNAYPSRHTKAEGKFTPQICRSRIFVPANECTRVVPMYPSQSQSAMSHLHSLAQSMYIATFLPEHVLTTCFADYVTSTSGAIRLAFDLLPLASSSRSHLKRAYWKIPVLGIVKNHYVKTPCLSCLGVGTRRSSAWAVHQPSSVTLGLVPQ